MFFNFYFLHLKVWIILKISLKNIHYKSIIITNNQNLENELIATYIKHSQTINVINNLRLNV